MSSLIRKSTHLGSSLTKRPSSSSFSSTDEPLNPSFVKSELDEARASLRAKSSAFSELETERDSLAASLAAARSEVADAKASLESSEKDHKQTQEDLLHARRQIAELEAERDRKDDAFRVVCEELDAVREDAALQDALAGIKQSQAQHSAISIGLEYEAHFAASAAEIDSLRSANEQLRTESESTASQNQDLAARVAALTDELASSIRDRQAREPESIPAEMAAPSTEKRHDSSSSTVQDANVSRTASQIKDVLDGLSNTVAHIVADLRAENATRSARIATLEAQLHRAPDTREQIHEMHLQTRMCVKLLEELVSRPSTSTIEHVRVSTQSPSLGEPAPVYSQSVPAALPQRRRDMRVRVASIVASMDAMDVLNLALLTLLCVAIGPFFWKLYMDAVQRSRWLRANTLLL